MHQMTKNGGCKLRFHVQHAGTSGWYWAEYSTFVVADETSGYQLTVAGFSGNVHDSFGPYNGDTFKTPDQDVCAAMYAGGFWYGSYCGGPRVNAADHWFDWPQLAVSFDNLMYSQMWLQCAL